MTKAKEKEKVKWWSTNTPTFEKRNGQKAKQQNWKLVLLFPVSTSPSSNTAVSKNMKLQFYRIPFTLSSNRVCTTNKPSQLYCSVILA